MKIPRSHTDDGIVSDAYQNGVRSATLDIVKMRIHKIITQAEANQMAYVVSDLRILIDLIADTQKMEVEE